MAKILIVEDTEDILEMLDFIIQRHGHQSSMACCRAELLANLSIITPDLILMDVMLKNEDGRKLCKEVKEMNPNIKVILLSASFEKLKSYRENKADDFIEKPFDINTLLAKINKHLS